MLCLQKNYELPILCERDKVKVKIKNAARIEKDKRTLLDVQGSDLKAIKYSYYRTCYASYTNEQTLDSICKHTEKQMNSSYNKDSQNVCDIIKDSVMKKKKKINIEISWQMMKIRSQQPSLRWFSLFFLLLVRLQSPSQQELNLQWIIAYPSPSRTQDRKEQKSREKDK